VYDVKESFEQSLNKSTDDSGRNGNASVTRTFTVATLANARPVSISNAPGIPLLGEAHPESFFLRCRSHSVETISPIFHRVTCTYIAKESTGDNTDNPLLIPAEVEFFDISSEEETDEDITGKAIATVNGEPISGITMPLTDIGWRVTRNLPSFNAFGIGFYTNKTNSAPFLGWPAGTVRISGIRANNVFTEDFEYWRASVEFHGRVALRTTNAKAWYKRVRHEGFMVLEDGKLIRAHDGEGAPLSNPVLLKADGTLEQNPSNADWLEFQVMNSVDFNNMNLL
jgi:hypothetical protein